MIVQEKFTLYNGVKIPKLGLGTWLCRKNDIAGQAVRDAVEIGYRHIDTAQQAYGNEAGLGEGIRAAAWTEKISL